MSKSHSSSLFGASLLMAAGTLVSRVLGFAKSALLVLAIGSTIGGAADAFDVANKIPNTIYMLLSGGIINAVLVPQIVKAARHLDGGKEYIDRLLTLAGFGLATVALIATISAPLLVSVYSSPAWSEHQKGLAVAFAIWCLPQIFFYGIYAMVGQVLNAKSNFGPYMWAPALNNIVAIAGLIAFITIFGPGAEGQHSVQSWSAEMIALLAGSATLGVALQALILIWPLAKVGYTWKPSFRFRGMGLRGAGKIAGWAFAMMLVGQAAFVVTSRVASTASSTGGVSSASNAAYSLSFLIFMLPHSLISVSLVTVLFTRLSSFAAEGDAESISKTIAKGLKAVGFANVCAMFMVLVLSVPVAMVITAGQSIESARTIAPVITSMIVGLVPFSANYLLQRAFYAYEDAKTPFLAQLPATLLTVVGVVASGCLLPTTSIVAGIGASMSFGYIVSMVTLLVCLIRRVGQLRLGGTLVAHAKFLVSGVVSAVFGKVLLEYLGVKAYSGFTSSLLTILLVGIVMLVTYVLGCVVLRAVRVRSLIGEIRGVRR